MSRCPGANPHLPLQRQAGTALQKAPVRLLRLLPRPYAGAVSSLRHSLRLTVTPFSKPLFENGFVFRTHCILSERISKALAPRDLLKTRSFNRLFQKRFLPRKSRRYCFVAFLFLQKGPSKRLSRKYSAQLDGLYSVFLRLRRLCQCTCCGTFRIIAITVVPKYLRRNAGNSATSLL